MTARGVASRASLALALLSLATAHAQEAQKLDSVVVTATREAERAFDLPVAIESVDSSVIQSQQLQVNLSESLSRIPGIVVANRWNYAQDLQVSSRGFGSRATFGTRGIRLFQDGIPATMPDGQGQTGSFSLPSAQRIEVMRGPFSTLYGNASGGVIAVFTEDGTDPPQGRLEIVEGSFGQSNTIVKYRAQSGIASGTLADNHFETSGFREHSAARRDLFNAKLKLTLDDGTRITMIGNTLYQPEAQDPLGLTRAQWEADPRQVDPTATQFNTRKTVGQNQAGIGIEKDLSADTQLRLTTYGGGRGVRQYLALSGVGLTSSGGVTDLDRDYEGVDLRVVQHFHPAGGLLNVTAGFAYDRQHEHRRGYVNNNGDLGDLRRDEDDYVSNRDVYAQLEWIPIAPISVLAGVRYSQVRYSSLDHYINASNPDDSGATDFTHTSPVGGVVWHAADTFNVYANAGEGFETPTFAEMAYRNNATGLNFDLKPAVSNSYEIGAKWLPHAAQRVNLALFETHTKDEIVIDTATGGRTTYKNASRTLRRGVEASWQGDLGAGFGANVAYTYLLARFESDFTTGSPPLPVPAGSRLPGVPAQDLFAELTYANPSFYGFSAGAELQYTAKVYVNERNSDAAPSYTIANLRAGFEQRTGSFGVREYVRVNNVTNRNYIGSVIVDDTNGRYFEPAPGRNLIAGIAFDVKF